MQENMAHLHVHDDYSNLRLVDVINKIKDLINKAGELGNKGIAITDHESLSGHIQALLKVKDAKKNGIIPEEFKLVLGNEIYLVNSLEEVKDQYQSGVTKFWHFILLAKDAIGHRQLRELSSLAWDNLFRTGTMERVPTLKRELERVVREQPGHLIASTACIGGELGCRVLAGEIRQAYEFIEWCTDLFGEDDFYLEMQPSDSPEQVTVNKFIFNTGRKYIITCDAHYINKEDRVFHDAYLKSHEEERETGDFYKTTYMMDVQEIHEYLDPQIGSDAVDEGLQNTLRILDRVEEYDLYHSTIVPAADIPNFEVQHIFSENYDKYPYIKKFAYSEDVFDRYLLYLIENGFYEKAYHEDMTAEEFHKLVSRIEVELSEMWKVTEKINTSISSYYLTTLELIDIMWNEGDSLVGPARGSVTGMYTMYLIGLIQVNPMKWNLPHWRHISWQKAELSDVDLDSQRNRRGRIIQAIKARKGERRVLNACTFKTEGSKSAILTAARGLGIDNDTAQYIAGMIPVTRGFVWPLKDCLEGNVEEDRKPVTEFKNEISKIPGLLETALKIEGLISGRSIHASAVYLFNEDFTVHNARMRAPNGTPITQFNMKDSDYMGGLKCDQLTVKGLDIIRFCMDFLIEKGYWQWQGSLRATYDKYLHPDVIDYDTPEMWDWIGENKVVNLFQFDTQTGLQAAQRIKPHSLEELAAANSVMRLMTSGDDAEQPIDTYIRYKNDISQWYDCMRNQYHLTEDEIKTVEPYLLPTYGIGDTQEVVMKISMDPKVCNFNVAESNKLRKSISKKDKDLQAKMKKEFFERGEQVGASENLLNYIWTEVIGKQLGYSFSLNHTVPYSIIGLQELNLAYHYPIVYWNTACLIVNAGADEETEDNKSTAYGKIATAISNIQKRGCEIALPLINSANFGFTPDEEHNRIIYSLKAINGLGDDVVRTLIEHRPYKSMDDFYTRMLDTGLIKTSQMIQLIKAGAFVELDNQDRRVTMANFLKARVIEFVSKLTMQQFDRLIQMDEKYHCIPEEVKDAIRDKFFKDYVLDESFLYKEVTNPDKKVPKKGYHDRLFKLDEVSMPYFQNNYTEDAVEGVEGEFYIISEKAFLKENKKKVQPLKDWFSTDEALAIYNDCLFRIVWEKYVDGTLSKLYRVDWEKYADGTLSKWEMDSLSIYCTTEHELAHVQNDLYAFKDFFEMPVDPPVYDTYVRTITQNIDGVVEKVRKEFPKFEIKRIAGTVLDKDKNHHTVTVLTTTGVVTVKFSKGEFSYYDKQISDIHEDGKKSRVEASWFTRGNKIAVCGYRRDNQFRAAKYADTVWKHTCYLITQINEDGTIAVKTEREEV